MILKTKPFTVGCGIHLNPNGSDLRCGQQRGLISSYCYDCASGVGTPVRGTFNESHEIALCENCRVRQTANTLMELQKSKERSS